MERICYYCRHCQVADIGMVNRRCEKTGKKVETFDSCNEWESEKE